VGKTIFILFLCLCMAFLFYIIFKAIVSTLGHENRFKDKEVVFYDGKYWLVLGLFPYGGNSHYYEYSLMSVGDDHEIISVGENTLRKKGIRQQEHLEAKLHSEAFVDFYSENKNLEKKYGKKGK